jgi:hypothetical protein
LTKVEKAFFRVFLPGNVFLRPQKVPKKSGFWPHFEISVKLRVFDTHTDLFEGKKLIAFLYKFFTVI